MGLTWICLATGEKTPRADLNVYVTQSDPKPGQRRHQEWPSNEAAGGQAAASRALWLV